MNPLSKSQSSSHWYSKTGVPVYQVPMASKKGEMRPTTLADARKMGLLPSVTTIMKILDRPQLTAWKIDQAILSALTLPAIAGESIDDRARRIARDSETQGEEARKLGQLVHDALERFLLLGEITADPTILPLIQPFMQWWKENCIALHYAEKTVVNNIRGYAGRVDAKAQLKDLGFCIIDFKTRTPIKGTDDFRIYDEDGMQLAAYREADALSGMHAAKCLSIIINSQSPQMHVHVWDDRVLEKSMNIFSKLTDVWMLLKGYDPRITNTK